MEKGKVIPFPKSIREPVELTDALIREKIITGEAEWVGVFNQEGKPCNCYRLNVDEQTYYVFDLSTQYSSLT